VTVPEKLEQDHERRQFPRLRENCRIKVRPIVGAREQGAAFEAMTVNISGGGLRFRSETGIAAGEFLAVELTLPEFPSPVVALARSVFAQPAGALFDVGIEFWWVGWGDDTAQRAIAEHIKSQLRQDT
jgi:hypothetical protein